mmetsp:Transcript_58511/g.85586  ORF Transcript_58511/g.85586 Transcript_58511/m.85586 type:complete len:168 (-) Transcript_58511:85-588(-)
MASDEEKAFDGVLKYATSYFDISAFSPRYGREFFTVQVIDWSIIEETEKYVQFNILVQVGPDQWMVRRRFREFDNLWNEVRKVCPSACKATRNSRNGQEKAIRLPPKTLFFPRFDHTFLNERRVQLAKFLHQLLSIDEIARSTQMRRFLHINFKFKEEAARQNNNRR